MDTKRTNTTAEAMQSVAAEVLKEIESFKPHVVVTLDDNAFREIALPMAGSPDVAAVFSGMNGQPEMYNASKHFMNGRDVFCQFHRPGRQPDGEGKTRGGRSPRKAPLVPTRSGCSEATAARFGC